MNHASVTKKQNPHLSQALFNPLTFGTGFDISAEALTTYSGSPKKRYESERTLTVNDRPISILCASSESLLEEVFRIRYKVYCQQFKYEREDRFPNQLEHDDFDGLSKHFLIRDNITGKFLGTLRIVWPRDGYSGLIPLQQHYKGTFSSTDYNPSNLIEGSYGEASRLAVIYEENSDRRFLAELSRILYITAIAYFTSQKQMQNLYCFMEKRLARRLNMVGFPFFQVGGFSEHKGLRAPFCLKSQKDYPNLSKESQDFFGNSIYSDALTFR